MNLSSLLGDDVLAVSGQAATGGVISGSEMLAVLAVNEPVNV